MSKIYRVALVGINDAVFYLESQEIADKIVNAMDSALTELGIVPEWDLSEIDVLSAADVDKQLEDLKVADFKTNE